MTVRSPSLKKSLWNLQPSSSHSSSLVLDCMARNLQVSGKGYRRIVAIAGSKKLFVGSNWKYNGTKESISKLVFDINNAKLEKDVDVKSSLTDRIEISAQNSWVGQGGAFTSELFVEQLKDIGCKWVIFGHSEWRHAIGEDDQFIGKKGAYALSENLKVIACIREKLEKEARCLRDEISNCDLALIPYKIPSWDIFLYKVCFKGRKKCLRLISLNPHPPF
ncbi:hypothetical protein AMTRI_Chr03g46860 [Amborella trichopoda]